MEDVNKIVNDPELEKLSNLSQKEIVEILNQVSIEDIEDLMNELNGGEDNND